MKTKRHTKLWLSAIILSVACFASAPRLTAQVTVGLDEAPAGGALLQLKDKVVNGADPNSTRGLLLPRVGLDPVGSVTGTTTDKLVSSLKLTLPPATTVTAEQHVGLMIYNTITQTVTNANAPFAETKICPGVYVWDGSKWVRTMFKECQ
ncbi:hypothetical protein M2132_000493 [Dysgonomonas sp. PH5-45]|uniref:hypothetical protein n=1 Tax=unclassified Dysgonomonas TaxID=2630389 RepID=UPI00247678EA|nr:MULTISPECIES: hypothetical protein [unclassified Dysgonomonas]MDH6354171.1 hypothetical protein [Dysgonomonas sp. PH5-45]MDH6386978.1 hypothetical protein [Dysgonomonas sp. PH5-37]